MSEIIRIQPLGSSWETLGADRLRGIVPEGIVASANDWGPDAMSFTLKVEAGARRPDLLPFTPIELEIDGDICWAGFTWQRPSDANGYSVSCRGWQYHLDDDVLNRAYVITNPTRFQDERSMLAATLTAYTSGWQTQIGDGQLFFSLPAGASAPSLSSASAILDMGTDSLVKRVVVTFKAGGAGDLALLARVGSSSDGAAADQTYFLHDATLPTSDTTVAQTFTTARRFLFLEFYNRTAGILSGSEASWLRISSVQAFTDVAYESGNASILKADTVIKDVLPVAPLLNQSTSLIQAGTFSLPEYFTDGYVTPRRVMEAVNTLENYRLKIGGDDLRTLVYDLKPSVPLSEVGEWSGSEFSDATVSGENIYSRAVVPGPRPGDVDFASKRTQTDTLADRRGFQRSQVLQVSSKITPTVADRIADLWLLEHATAPFAGTLKIVGSGARWVGSGFDVAPHQFLRQAGEKIRLAHRIDPDTGAQGRDGRIAGVSYNHAERSVEIAIDDQRQRFETILARYAALVGG